MVKYIQFVIKEFLGINNDIESLLENQELIKEEKQKNYSDYLSLKNGLWLLFILGFIGGGFWLYSSDFLNSSTLESIKSLGNLSKDLHTINYKSILSALEELNKNSVNLSKEEVKLLLEIKDLLLIKGINENTSLDRPVSTILEPIRGGIVWDDQS